MKLTTHSPQLKTYNLKPKASGFSLLETTIAVAILVSAIVGPLGLASQSIKSASVARNNIIVSNLAQEGLELMRNYRSKNVLAGRSWTNGMDSCGAGSGCRIDPVDLVIRNCSATCEPLKFDSALHLFNYQSGEDSIFTRIIRLQNITANEVKITSSIVWSDRFGSHTFDLTGFLFNLVGKI